MPPRNGHLRISSASRAPQIFPRPDSPALGNVGADASPALGNVGADASEAERTYQPISETRPRAFARPRGESSSLAGSFSSLTQKTPARSYYQKSYHASHASSEAPQPAAQEVREDTAELATRALNDAGEPSSGRSDAIREAVQSELSQDGRSQDGSASSADPQASALTEMIQSTPAPEEAIEDSDHSDAEDSFGPVTVGHAIISQPHETTPLLSKPSEERQRLPRFSWPRSVPTAWKKVLAVSKFPSRLSHRVANLFEAATTPKIWNRQIVWRKFILRPASYLPAVLLGLLLNILDALSYGMILFPLGQPLFAELGPDGISMFYVSCIVSQLVYSLGGSIFRGGVGSEMIEVVPFFHKMAFTILAQVGEDHPRSVLATTILSYSVSSVLTGIVFFLMGQCKLGVLIGFFPRHILIGCIGGVGFFLIVTAIEVSARLEGNLDYNLDTLKRLVMADTLVLWLIPLFLSLLLFLIKRWVKHSLTDACFFLSVLVIFYILVTAIPTISIGGLRSGGWIFEAPAANTPWYHFYTLYDFEAVNWGAFASTVPAMFALTFFGVLHVPINIPALALTTGEDNVVVDRELKAHGYSNAISGFCGSIQNYLVYTNTVLFMRSGGDSRVAGVLLALATSGILVVGPVIIGFIPVMVVGALIFFLGFDLLHEALIDTIGRVSGLEYSTIIIIVLTMGIYDFVVGILVGIVLACAAFVLQSSQVSAIRGTLPGSMASSMVRRHATQRHFLQEVGSQIFVTKLAGFLFFGTIVGVENKIRALLKEDSFSSQPIRFLVLDLSKVDGVDYSAAEAFTRINRLLNVRDVEMIMCGFSTGSSVGKALYNVGLLDGPDQVQYYSDLNSALESCENDLLKAFYEQKDILDSTRKAAPQAIEVPSSATANFPYPDPTSLPSPRRGQLHRAATLTLTERESSAKHQRWHSHPQPLSLILQTFADFSSRDDDFWARSTPFFHRRRHAAGTVLYRSGETPDGFYLVETGMLKAHYALPQGAFSEVIVAGATCGELPFFSGTERTSTTVVERDAVLWVLTEADWKRMQETEPEVSRELLKVGLGLSGERMGAITKYMLLTGT